MYAAGQGAEKSNLTALIWLNCAAGDDRAGDVKSDSLRTRSEIEEQAGQVISFLGRLLARVRCSGSSWTTPYNPEREKVQDKVFFFPGDMTIVAALNLSHVFSFSWLTDMILAGYRNMGSVLVGTISLLVWALSIKGLIVAATAIDTSSNSWMRKPTGVSNPHQPKKKNPKGKKRKQKEKQPQPAGE